MGTEGIVITAIAAVLLFGSGIFLGVWLEKRQIDMFMEGQRSGWGLRDVSGMAQGEIHVPDAEVPLQTPVTIDPFVFGSGDESGDTEPE